MYSTIVIKFVAILPLAFSFRAFLWHSAYGQQSWIDFRRMYQLICNREIRIFTADASRALDKRRRKKEEINRWSTIRYIQQHHECRLAKKLALVLKYFRTRIELYPKTFSIWTREILVQMADICDHILIRLRPDPRIIPFNLSSVPLRVLLHPKRKNVPWFHVVFHCSRARW